MRTLTLLAGLLVAGVATAQENQVTLKKGDRIHFYGDSLTEQAQTPKGWVTLLREHFKKNHAELDIDVTVHAVGGYSIVNRVRNLDREVFAKKPTIVVLQGGVPDALSKFTDDEFKTALETIIDRLKKENVRIVLCSCTSLGERKDGGNRADKRLDEFAEIARQVAKDKKVPLNDLRKAFQEYWAKNNPENKTSGILTNDGNHFNDVGNRFVADQMLKMFGAGAKLDKLDEQAKEQAEKFIQAITAQDLDATLKTVDVPFFWDGVDNFKDRDILKDYLQKMLARDQIKGLKYDVQKIVAFGELPEKAFNAKDTKHLKDILKPADRVVMVRWRAPARDGVAVFVRIREGAAKVVGFRD